MALTQAEINSINAAFDGALSRFFKPSSKGNVAGSSNSNTNAQKRALENSTAKLNALSESADDVKKSFSHSLREHKYFMQRCHFFLL